MVNFVCISLTGQQVPRWAFLGVFLRCFWMRLAFESCGLSKLDFLPSVGGSCQSGPKQDKDGGRGHPFFPAPLHKLGPIFLLWPSDEDLHQHQLPCSQDFGLGLDYNTAFPGSQPADSTILGLLGLENGWYEQFLIINLTR